MKIAIRHFFGKFPGVAVATLMIVDWPNLAAADPNQKSTAASSDRAASSLTDHPAVAERIAISREMDKLMKSGASSEQISAWHAKNAARLDANQQKLAEMSAKQSSAPQPYIREVQIPPGASEAMKEFLMERAKLNNKQILIHNQPLKSSPEERGAALEAWQERNATALKAQAARASRISAESPPLALRVPTSADIPLNATPELRDFLTRRNTLIQAENEIIAELKEATPAHRQQALEAWRAENPLPFRAMQDAAVRLSNESKTSH